VDTYDSGSISLVLIWMRRKQREYVSRTITSSRILADVKDTYRCPDCEEATGEKSTCKCLLTHTVSEYIDISILFHIRYHTCH
jgi:hypothetical protein